MILPIDICPHCEESAIFYRRDYMRGSSWFFASNTQEIFNDSMYDGLKTTEGKVWYCDNCHKAVFADKDVINDE